MVHGRELMLCSSESKAVCVAAVDAARKAVGKKPVAKKPAEPLTSVQQSAMDAAQSAAATAEKARLDAGGA